LWDKFPGESVVDTLILPAIKSGRDRFKEYDQTGESMKSIRLFSLLSVALITVQTAVSAFAAPRGFPSNPVLPGSEVIDPDAAAMNTARLYSESVGGQAMVVLFDGQIIFEGYGNGGAQDRAQTLASGTKSFVGAAAMAAGL
jgi:CubicO group peptidase (beta-lactamase class C family)